MKEDELIVFKSENLTYHSLKLLVLFTWTFLSAGVTLFYWYSYNNQVVALAMNTAHTALNKDLASRKWVIGHGGIYVPISASTPPSIYLKDVPERDIKTPSGVPLTLMNSSYVLRQMIENYGTLYGENTRISSINPLNPDNKADKWQSKAIEYLGKHPSQEKYNEIETIEDETYVRMMIPMITDKKCQKCHNPNKNPIGGMRGGIDISVPLKDFYVLTESTSFKTFVWLLLIWITGFIATIVVFKVIQSKAEQIRNNEIEKIKNYQNMISLIIDLLDKRDSYTAGHSSRVAEYCEIIAMAIYNDESVAKKIKETATMHDIGKIAIPDSILLKPGKLSDFEFKLIQYHLTAGYELLSKVEIYRELAEIMRYHHERFDGNGYPNGIAGEEIPPLSRIMIIADAFDAMTTDRIYKPRKSVEEALREIERLKGTQFDPTVADVAIRVLRNINIETTSQLPITDIEQERFAYFLKDQLTGLNNHWALESILGTNEYTHDYRFATVIAIENMADFNSKYGWEVGDILLKDFGTMLMSRYSKNKIFRIFGDNFVILGFNFLDISNTEILTIDPLQGKDIVLSVNTIHLIEENINSIRSLEVILKGK